MSQQFGTSRANSTTSHRNDGSSTAASATGSVHGSDPKRHLANAAQYKAPPRPPSRSSSTTGPGPHTGKQPTTQRTGPAQFTPATNRPNSTASTEDLAHRPLPAGDTRSTTSTGNPSTHPGERGRSNQTSTAADPVPSRESSSGPSEGSSESEASDDEDHAQDSADYSQPDASADLASRGSGAATAPAGRHDQYAEETNPTAAPSSGDSSPILSEDISPSVSLNSGDSSRGSPGNTPEKPRVPKPGRGGAEDPSGPTRHPAETQDYGPAIDTSDTYSTVTPNASSVNLPKAKIENSEDNGEHSATHVPPVELRSLTDLGSECPAATEAVKYLFQAVGRDVVSFRRNTQVSYMVVERARDIVTAINGYVAKVENSVDGDWDSFEKFTEAIEPLEDILFKLLAFTEDEKARYFASTASIDECISSAESWASNREELSRALEGFDTRQELVGLFQEPDTDSRKLEHQEAQTYDDRSLLGDMKNTIHNLISEDPNRFPSYVREVETSLDRLQLSVIHGSPPDWITVITIQTSMLVEGVMEMVKDAVLDPEVLSHLKSRPIWKAASELIGVLEVVDGKQPALPQVVQAKYDAFVQALRNIGKIVLPGTYVDLMKQAGRIRRPFQAQAFALIMLCRFLADKFTALGGSAATVENLNSLEDAFDKTLVALQAATKAVTVLRNFDLTNFEGHPMVKVFGDAEALIRDSFKSFNLDAEWAQKQSELTAALHKDKERMMKLNEMLNRSPESTTAKVDVHVSIHDKSPLGPQLGASSVVEESTIRLLALRWNVASVLGQEDIKRARAASTFYKRIDGRWSEIVTSSSTLGEIVGGQSEVALRLVIT